MKQIETQNFFYEGENKEPSRIEYPDGGWEEVKYDDKGNVVHYKDSTGSEEKTVNTYDKNGNLTSRRVVFSDNFWKEYKFDSNGKEYHYVDSSGFERATMYNSNGDILQEVDSKGNEVNYKYDTLNRVIEINYAFEQKY